MHWVGTTANILRYVTGPDGSHHLVVQGEERFRILEFLDGWDFPVARVERIPQPDRGHRRSKRARCRSSRKRIETLRLLPQVPEEMVAALQNVEAPALLADLVAGLMDVAPRGEAEALETFDLKDRLDKLLDYLSKRIEVLKLSREIDERTKESIDSHNREHLPARAHEAIQKELGEDDETKAELEELKKALDEAGMPEEVEKHARKELKRLERMPEAAGEYSMVRTYLEWLTSSRGRSGREAIDIAEARRILDADHYGLQKIKRRILEYLAVRKLNPQGKSPILCFVGPPGVGKTSLGQSIARATGTRVRAREPGRRARRGGDPRPPAHLHRRAAGQHHPGHPQGGDQARADDARRGGQGRRGGFHGDPSSALLEVLDPEQNSTFRTTTRGAVRPARR
jgi:ATP-dependent Lon protease